MTTIPNKGQQLMDRGYRPARKPMSIYGYKIPNPMPNVWLSWTCILAVVLCVLIVVGKDAWIPVGIFAVVAAFHGRNKIVQWEIDQGRHDPLWGLHIMRQHQAELDEATGVAWMRRLLTRLSK